MNGKNSLHKSMRGLKSNQVKVNHRRGDYLDVGSWRFEENDEGDLVVLNLETGKEVTLILK